MPAIKGELEEVREGGGERDELRMAEGWGSQRQREVEGGKQSEQPAELRAS